jgi:signal transduction histidine kinase/CheY-like chemotaxis protein
MLKPSLAMAESGKAAEGSPALTPHRRRVLRQLEWAAQLAWLLPLAAFAVIAALLYAREIHEAGQAIDRSSRAAQEQALKLFETNAMLQQRMADLLGDSTDAELLARGRELHQKLKRMSAGLPQVQGLFIIGADARALATSLVYPPPRQIDYSDRESIRVHWQPGTGIFFTEQLRSRLSGEPFFDMSARRSLSDGSFGGTLHVSLRPDYLTNFYAELAATEPGMRFAVLKADGRFIARWPDPMPPEGRLPANDRLLRPMAAGVQGGRLDGVSPIDGARRLRMFRRLAPYPVYVVAAISLDAVREAWLREIGLLGLFALPITVGLTWMARLALSRTRRELVAAQRLDDETALRQRMEIALMQSQRLEALGRLTGGVAHDFNNLLMVITTNLYLQRRLTPELASSAPLAAIDRAATAGTQLTRQLLAFSRRQALMPQRVEMKEQLPHLLELLKPVLGRRIAVQGQVDEDAPAIEVDPAELELALINLAVNAKAAMPEGGSFQVRARRARPDDHGLPEGASPPASWLVLEACDTGTGIAPEIVDRVFDPFFTTKPVGHGTGLGLSQVQAFCQSAGGNVRIESGAEGGTCVVLCFPGLSSDEAAPVARPVDAHSVRLRGRVLLVEDNDAVAEATGSLLIAMGLTIDRAGSAEAALAILKRDATRHDLVLSDIEMPGMDGIALAEELRARHPELPVLLVTGYAARLQEAVTQRLEVLPKPVLPATLAEALARLLPKETTSPVAMK